jgi:hypothetical protein
MSDMPKIKDLKMFPDGTIGFDMPKRTPEEIKARKARSTMCGHVKRRILRNERLKGKTLEFALTTVDDVVGEKLITGTLLTEYEKHLVVDVWLLHTRLAPL